MVSFCIGLFFLLVDMIGLIVFCLMAQDWWVFLIGALIGLSHILGVFLNLVSIIKRNRGYALASLIFYGLTSITFIIWLIPMLVCMGFCLAYWSCNSPAVNRMEDDEKRMEKL